MLGKGVGALQIGGIVSTMLGFSPHILVQNSTEPRNFYGHTL